MDGNAVPSSPDFSTLFWRSKDRANLCILTLLAWLSACDGSVSADEEAFLRRVAGAANQAEIESILDVAKAARIEDMEIACRFAMTRLSRGRKRLLAQLAITLAASDGRITVGENLALQFLADLLGIAPRTFAKLFQQVTHRPFPEAGDPSTIDWWHKREAGVQAEPAFHLPPDPPAEPSDSKRSESPQVKKVPEMTQRQARTILGLSDTATPDEVRAAFRRLAKVRHPDRYVKLGPSAVAAASEAFKQLDAAYTLLKGAA